MAYKANMEKPFDKMEWPFITLALKHFGFPPLFINWISCCLPSISISILLNGSSFGHFMASRGRRQGDPLSPFLFIIGSEILFRLLSREEELSNLKGLQLGPHGPIFSTFC